MKNQYFGDINDYRKYGILRGLAGDNFNMLIYWMLTTDDDRTDGKKTEYLDNPSKYESFDPQLFQNLKEQVKVKKRRDVKVVEEYSLIPNAVAADFISLPHKRAA